VVLLERFLQEHDESAFESLVARHSRMVWSLTRRTVADEQYSEDVFQAVFLVMVAKAHTIRSKDSLATWLYKVTRRLAVEAQEELREKRTDVDGRFELKGAFPDLKTSIFVYGKGVGKKFFVQGKTFRQGENVDLGEMIVRLND
jgi:RNA polymerase sigma factor (sigma-70 family)